MTKFLTCLVAIAMTAGLAVAQIDIDDVQVYTPEGAPNSPYVGQTITVEGIVFCPPGIYNGGTHYLMDDTGGMSFFNDEYGPPIAALGDRISVTGEVGDFGGEIQIQDPNTVVILETGVGVPDPVATLPTELINDYERIGDFVSVIGTVSVGVSGGFNKQFALENGTEDGLIIYVDGTTLIDLSAVEVGDEYKVISPVVVYNGLIELKPRYQGDLVEDPLGDTLPVIENAAVDNWTPETASPITFSADISDNSAVTSAFVYVRYGAGDWTSYAMTNTGGTLYEYALAGGHPSDQIDYYFEATDDGDQTATLPGDAPDSFRSLAVGFTSIYDLQYVDIDLEDDTTPYDGLVLNIRGVVTAGTGQAGAPSKFILQEQEAGPYDGYSFGGVLVYESSAGYEPVFRGDLVEVGGAGEEYNGITEMIPHESAAVTIVEFGVDLPAPMRISTRMLADNNLEDGDGRFGEAYESVWIKTRAAVVVDTLGYGEYIISDTTARADSVLVDPMVNLTYEPTIGDVIFVEGFMDCYYDFDITPIGDQFITVTEFVPVEDTPTVEAAGGFTAVYPNPFNPSTTISFVVNREELAQLNIYNLRGELVRSLVNEQLPMGDYKLTWDGRNAGGETVASGQYFARLRIGKSVVQVREMSLIK